MKQIQLGSLQVPAIGLGTYRLTGREAIPILQDAFNIGYRLIDTAQLYNNEKEVGEAMHHSGIRRHQFTLITKVWPSNFSKDRFLSSVKESLKKLKTDHVDLLLIHWPHPHLAVKDYIHFLAQAQAESMTREIGVSNYNIAQLKSVQAEGIPIVTNEIEYHPWIDQHKLISWMQEHKMPVIAYTPLGRGKMQIDKTITSIASNHACSPAQVILQWMMQQDQIIAIPKASSREHLRENIDLPDMHLSKEEMQLIGSLGSQNYRVVGAQPGARWD
jgi:2,5-diketo-D-gluconate reductase B